MSILWSGLGRSSCFAPYDKDKINQNPSLTDKEKEELKVEIDRIAEEMKERIDKAETKKEVGEIKAYIEANTNLTEEEKAELLKKLDQIRQDGLDVAEAAETLDAENNTMSKLTASEGKIF